MKLSPTPILAIFYTLVALLICPLDSSGQSELTKAKTKFDAHMQRAENFMTANLHGEALQSVRKAAKSTEKREELMKAWLFEAELLRSTQNHPKALEVLLKMKQLDFTEKERLMEIKMLGRLAAVHQELGKYPVDVIEDSVRFYIESALKLTAENPKKYEFEIASLYNELGMFVYRKGNTPEARKYYQIACSTFEKLGEDQYLITPLSNLLELESCTYNHGESKKLAEKLEQRIKGRTWYSQMIGAYNALRIFANIQKDTIAELNYLNNYLETHLRNERKINSDKMLALSEIYERDKLKQEIVDEKLKRKQKSKELKDAQDYRNRLLLYLVIALVVGVGVVILFIRERRTKQKMNRINEALNQAQERYRLLVVESNHRIKNNLQMITAMLEYTGKGIEPSNRKVLRSISGKINAISALHKFLYVDIHNEFIPVETYFKELIKLYDEISSDQFAVKLEVGDVQIRSERIVYFGLIVNEMLSNTLEHSPDTMGKIHITITKSEDGFLFTYFDASTRSKALKEGMGSELIRNLVARVGGSGFSLDPHSGTYQFYFKVVGSGDHIL